MNDYRILYVQYIHALLISPVCNLFTNSSNFKDLFYKCMSNNDLEFVNVISNNNCFH